MKLKEKNINAELEKKLNEDGIGSNYKTIDPTPIDFFHDSRVDVEMFPSGEGEFNVIISCPDLNFSGNQHAFDTEEAATNWARNAYTELISKLDSKLEEQLMINVFERLERCFRR